MSNTTPNRSIDASLEFWVSRALRLLRTKHATDTSSPQKISEAIANKGTDHIVHQLFDELLEQKDVKPEWQKEKMIIAAVDDLLYQKTKWQ